MKWMFKAFLILCFLLPECNAFSQGITKPLLVETAKLELLIPNEQRDEKYAKFLSCSVKVSSGGGSGSGTICGYDSEFAYVISCGHLWDGDKPYSKITAHKAKIFTWYQNSIKLSEPKSYDAEILFWSNQRGYDVSLLRFKPDWIPDYFPIASEFKPKENMSLNSMGCDGGKEVARYEVKIQEFNGTDLVTIMNSPRPGRSGGGLLTEDGELVGVCWGTSDTVSGDGIGFFTKIQSIKEVFVKNEHEWLLGLKKHSIPIIDWDFPERTYARDFVPFPKRL
jgi:hypothetical protein